MERRKTLTISHWDGLGDEDDDDERFFESFDRISSAVPLDLASSGSDEDDDEFDDSRMSFASTVSSAQVDDFRGFAGSMSPEYDVWMAAPGSIRERRKRLLQGMGLSTDKEFQRLASTKTQRVVSQKFEKPEASSESIPVVRASSPPKESKQEAEPSQVTATPIVLVRSRSDGEIESFAISRRRKDDFIGGTSKQRLTRTYSVISAHHTRVCQYPDSVGVSPKNAIRRRSFRHAGVSPSIASDSRFNSFFLIRNLDTGKEFIVNEYDEEGMWNRLSDIQTGKQLTMEEFEKCVGFSPVVKELMRRENVSTINDGGSERKFNANSYFSKSLRLSKRRGAALLKNIKGVANSMSGLMTEREQPVVAEQKPTKNSSSEWIKVRQTGKSHKDLSALHLCQEIQAHQGSIWTMRFSSDAHYLASAGEDRVIHVWEVQDCEVMRQPEEGSDSPLQYSLSSSPDRVHLAEVLPMPSEKRKKGIKGSASRKVNALPDYVHVPETVFSLSEKPVCTFQGHLDDVLDLSWSRSQQLLSSSMDKTVRLWDIESKTCLKLFAHNDYVTCIQFNPIDDDYFISGSLDAKVRIWNVPHRKVVDYTDLHEMVTAACYSPDGQTAYIGSHKGSCRLYNTEGCKLSQKGEVLTKKKTRAKKVTGLQFAPGDPCDVLITSADSRIRIVEGSDLIHKFRGFRNTSSQISASFSPDGKYVICASEDSQVYVWKRDEPRNAGTGKPKMLITRSHEHFQCRDVSVAIPWPGSVKGEPPPVPVHSKRHSKRSSTQPSSITESLTREDNASAANSKRNLPPLPKKSNVLEKSLTQPEEELAQLSRLDSGTEVGESFNSASASIRYGDSSPSISSAANPSSSWSSSWSWLDGSSSHGNHAVQATAWGLVIVTAGLGGEIRAYQNFGLPRRISRQANLF